MKRIGIDARFYGIAGPGRYVSNLVKNLEKYLPEGFEVYVFLTSKGMLDYSTNNKRFHPVLCDVSWYSWKEQLLLPWFFSKYRLDLLHVPHFNFPILYLGRLVLTVHDLIINRFSTERATTKFLLYYRFKRLVYRFVVWWGVKRAKRIIVPSNYVKQELMEGYNKLSKEKIAVTYEGVDSSFGGSASVMQSWGPYILYVGSMYPHKNLERLVGAFAKLRHDGTFTGDLVLAGKEDYFSNRLREEIKVKFPDLGFFDVIFPALNHVDKYINDTELSELYQNARALVFPSLSEGFGLPPLEAMRLRCPVVASNATSIPEVCGDAAVYFDPLDVNDIAEKIKQVVSNEDLRRYLIARGQENLKRFSWQRMAEETLKVYENCLGTR